MFRGFARRLPAVALALALAPGCRLDTAAVPGHGWADVDLDVNAARYNAQYPSPTRPTTTATGTTLQERLKVPSELPGADSPPSPKPTDNSREARAKSVAALFADPTALPPDPVPAGRPLSLDQLQRDAANRHPTIRQAAAAVASARGLALQAGLPPNPSVGFEADTVGSGGTAGQQGVKLEQLIKTAGKLQLAQAAAGMDVLNAEVAFRKARLELATKVRAGYYGVLVAEEQLRVNFIASRFMDEALRVQVERFKDGQAAEYEPRQLRALAAQTRAALAQAHVHYVASWRQLAAAVGEPALPSAPLAGSAAEPVPELPFDVLQDRTLVRHTDVATAHNGVLKARYSLRLAQVTPVPDVALKLVVQKDYSTPPFATTTNVEIGVPIPVWDRNQGNVHSAEAELAKALDEAQRVQLELLAKLAEAADRYAGNRLLVEASLKQILPDQVRAYRGVLERHQKEPDEAKFDDVLLAGQNLVASLTAYLGYLSAQWTAAVDLAGVAQVDDLAECLGSITSPTTATPASAP